MTRFKREPDRLRPKEPFVARYTGTRCGLCDERITEGDLVEYLDDQLCHTECAQDEDDRR